MIHVTEVEQRDVETELPDEVVIAEAGFTVHKEPQVLNPPGKAYPGSTEVEFFEVRYENGEEIPESLFDEIEDRLTEEILGT